MKFTFTAEMNEQPLFRNSLEFDCEYIGEVVENFELFLKGTGYHTDNIKEHLTGFKQ